jgi:tRNA1Val (adenine37-N6)-methyltransferase
VGGANIALMLDDLRLSPGEQSVALTRDFRLIQKRRGHRYSVDDMLVAHLALTRGGAPPRVLDLGCGIGSVLLTAAWALPSAELVGLERLPEQAALAMRNVALNRCAARVRVVTGDLRDRALVESLGAFDLVTGSPPYFSPGSGTPCADPVRTAAHFELAGGIEEYAAAAAIALSPQGRFIACAPASPAGRTAAALRAAGLALHLERAVLPRPGKPPFLLLLVAAREPVATLEEAPPLVLRQQDGRLSAEHVAIREATGIPCRDQRR